MDVSLIISTRDRCHQLARCLSSVKRITFEQPWELIVVDNGSLDQTVAVVRSFIDSCPFPVVYLHEPRGGKSHALNTALRIARGKIIAFTDDDCYPEPDFLNSLWSTFEDRSLGFVTGRILLHDPADARMTIKESTQPITFPARSFIGSGEVSGANMALRRELLLDLGGFDPVFGPGAPLEACEDLDLAGRASAAGWKGLYQPDAVVRHHHGRKAKDLPPLLKSYGIGAGAYHMKLLLNGGQVRSFARSMCQVRRRLRASRISILWEPVGAAKYSSIYLTRALRATYFKTRRAGS
jgi:cellulose synthase/poly-beta-1,6-N-acetylglucosamine synthase-like glycosyltransferase